MLPSLSLNGGDAPDEDDFDAVDDYVPEHLPDPGPFLTDQRVLRGDEHAAFHARTEELFEERGVYDVTFGYNLARLNADRRHPEAGFRYAVEREAEGAVLRAEFTPTTEFCPQAESLATAALRAWNDCTDRHDYDAVRVRVAPMHQQAAAIDRRLRDLEPAIE